MFKKFALLIPLMFATPILALPEPATIEQTLQCLNPNLNSTAFPETYATCTNLIIPYVCETWASLPQGFTTPLHLPYMTYWNNFCFSTYKQGPPG